MSPAPTPHSRKRVAPMWLLLTVGFLVGAVFVSAYWLSLPGRNLLTRISPSVLPCPTCDGTSLLFLVKDADGQQIWYDSLAAWGLLLTTHVTAISPDHARVAPPLQAKIAELRGSALPFPTPRRNDSPAFVLDTPMTATGVLRSAAQIQYFACPACQGTALIAGE